MTSPWCCWLVFLTAISFPVSMAAGRAADQPEILTPPPAPEPRINGARVFGVRPGHPLLYTIAATGRRPMRFSVTGLPEGLQVDEGTGRISGAVAQRGSYRVTLRAENALGRAERELRIVVGDELLLTPLLGCNTWGGWGPRVTDVNLRAAAKAMVDSGLIQHGWQYVNIDDGWQGQRGGPHRAIQPNEKFGDMRGLCEYIHSLGLKAGIYSTPWTTSYAGFVGGSSDDPQGVWQRPKTPRDGWHFGKYFFEANDARQWAEWGFDYAKYDWGVDKVEVTKRMVDALAACDRDIVLELSNSVPLAQAAEHTRLAQLSRTTGDLVDLWDRSQMDAGLRRWAVGIREVWLAHDAWAPHQRPGHWNHACNLRIGLLGGWRDQPLTPSRLAPDEQYAHISLWCLWGSPMIIGTPIERLDPFTLSLLSNDEVLEINQDPLGKQARPAKAAGGEALVKELEDGTKAVGLFNPGAEPARVSLDWSTMGLQGPQRVRDLWRQKDLGVHPAGFTAEIRPHGVVLVRLVPAAR
jgi:alpha-galactosidase